jgi:hypothetical protein
MRYGSPDRVPYFEEGLRDGVLERWREQGLPADADLEAMFHYDRRERVPVSLEPRPAAKRRPACWQDLQALARSLDADDPRRFPEDWARRVEAWRTRRHVLELPIHSGLFLTLGVGDWRTFEEAIYLLADEPALVRDVMAVHGEFAARIAQRILREVEVDCVSFSEPIGGNCGPLISPGTYEQVVLSSYRPILDVVRRHGVGTILLVTYANARALLPGALEAGFNALWAVEAAPEAMDYLELRREFGRDLRLVGGIDLDALLLDQAAIRRQIRRTVLPLLAQGGYIPLADGRVRPNVPFENYRCYRRLLERATRGR